MDKHAAEEQPPVKLSVDWTFPACGATPHPPRTVTPLKPSKTKAVETLQVFPGGTKTVPATELAAFRAAWIAAVSFVDPLQSAPKFGPVTSNQGDPPLNVWFPVCVLLPVKALFPPVVMHVPGTQEKTEIW
jgi:hypothetical protein